MPSSSDFESIWQDSMESLKLPLPNERFGIMNIQLQEKLQQELMLY